MESELLQLIVVFVVGLVFGALIMLLWNKLSSGSASAGAVKQEYQDYQGKVETHFEETSKKFQEMTEQYQDLYKHLSVGATSLCRPDSVAATLADQSQPQVRIESKEKKEAVDKSTKADKSPVDNATARQKDASVDAKREEIAAKAKAVADAKAAAEAKVAEKPAVAKEAKVSKEEVAVDKIKSKKPENPA